jgi:hypothetical protein
VAHPLRTKNLSVLGCSSRAVKPRVCCCLARATCETGSSISDVMTCLGGPRFRYPDDRFVAQLFFGSNPVLDIFSVFAAALKIQLMSSTSDLFFRWFSTSKHGNLLSCRYKAGASTDLHIIEMWDYFPLAETLIFICLGLDSSRFAICRIKTPLRYSARMLSELTVFGREKLRINGP